MADFSEMTHKAWNLAGIVLFLALFLLGRKARRAHVLLYALFNLPGSASHEIAHFIIGLALGARPSGFSLVPGKNGSSWRLGSVKFARIRAWNALPVGLAPLGLVPVAWLLWRHWLAWFPVTLSSILILYTALFYLLSNTLPSRQDMAIALNWRSVLLYAVLTLAGYEIARLTFDSAIRNALEMLNILHRFPAP